MCVGGGGGGQFFLSQHLGNITMQTMRFGIFPVILYKVRKKIQTNPLIKGHNSVEDVLKFKCSCLNLDLISIKIFIIFSNQGL